MRFTDLERTVAEIKETMRLRDKHFFYGLYWIVLLLVMILTLVISVDVMGGDMDMYYKAMRINNG